MIYEYTDDYDFITRCVTNPSVWRMGSDDGMVDIDPELYFIKPGGVIWVRAEEYGVFAFEKRNHITYDVHTTLLPNARGKSVEIAKGVVRWFFENSNCLRITTTVPEFNHLATRLSLMAGMTLIGVNKKSFLKNGQLFDQYLYGISKEDLCRFQR